MAFIKVYPDSVKIQGNNGSKTLSLRSFYKAWATQIGGLSTGILPSGMSLRWAGPQQKSFLVEVSPGAFIISNLIFPWAYIHIEVTGDSSVQTRLFFMDHALESLDDKISYPWLPSDFLTRSIKARSLSTALQALQKQLAELMVSSKLDTQLISTALLPSAFSRQAESVTWQTLRVTWKKLGKNPLNSEEFPTSEESVRDILGVSETTSSASPNSENVVDFLLQLGDY